MAEHPEPLDRLTADSARYRLATYGSLAPGQPNHHQLDGLDGDWSEGQVRGELIQDGWGATIGYPAIVLDPEGAIVPVHLFESFDLPGHWDRLDEFEGPGYARVAVIVNTAAGDIQAFIYALRQPQGQLISPVNPGSKADRAG